VPFFSSGFPAIAPGGIKPYTVNISVALDTAPVEGLVVKCTAYLKSGDLRTYPRKWEIYDPSNFLGAYSSMVVGRYVALLRSALTQAASRRLLFCVALPLIGFLSRFCLAAPSRLFA
jgi:hypothetical protein